MKAFHRNDVQSVNRGDIVLAQDTDHVAADDDEFGMRHIKFPAVAQL